MMLLGGRLNTCWSWEKKGTLEKEWLGGESFQTILLLILFEETLLKMFLLLCITDSAFLFTNMYAPSSPPPTSIGTHCIKIRFV